MGGCRLGRGRHPTRVELDSVCPDRPIYLPRAGHEPVVNSAALDRAGIIAHQVPDTGLLVEQAREPILQCLPRPTTEERIAALEAAQQLCLRQGITRVLDPGLGVADIGAYRTAAESGRLRLRATLLGLVPSGPDAVTAAETFLPLAEPGALPEPLRFGGYKVFFDGGGSLGTARCSGPSSSRRVMVVRSGQLHHSVLRQRADTAQEGTLRDSRTADGVHAAVGVVGGLTLHK